MRKRVTSLFAVALIALVTLGADTDQARFEKLGHEMVCTCGCNQILLECNHVGCPSSEKMRQELIAGMKEGKGDKEILAMFVAKYGPTVLAAPTATGFNLTAWVTPFAIFIAGLLTVMLVVRNWRFKRRV
ncbi:MAG: cytochrome c-type biogenesis protein CcmH [Acidobacteriales bacterium]|nr:cytochrome c-type biogenesis protein CcmH [Terriglobales bacterium]